jgi:hypothetical protein
MAPYRVVPHNKGGNNAFSLNKVFEPVVPDAFSLESANDAFRNSIALRITDKRISELESQPPCIVHKELSSVLASVIQFQFDIRDDVLFKPTKPIDCRHLNCIEGSSGCSVFRYPMAYDFSIMMINNREEPTPAIFFRPELGPVRAPHHI